MTPDLPTLLALVRQTQDSILWPEGDSWYVISPLAKYQRLIDGGAGLDIRNLSEDELVAKINQDIAEWRGSQLESDDQMPSFSINAPALPEKTEPEEQYYLEPVE